MRTFKKILLTASAALFALTATAAPAVSLQTTQVVAEAATMKLNKSSLHLKKGGTYKLQVKGKGKKKVKWSSSNSFVASVSKSGKVKGKNAGVAIINAKIGKKSLSCIVIVAAPANASQAEYFNKLKAYVDANYTDTSDNNEKILRFSYTDDDAGYYARVDLKNKSDGTLEASAMKVTDDNPSYSILDLTESGNVKTIINGYYTGYYTGGYQVYIVKATDYNPANYVKGKNSVPFEVTTNNSNYDDKDIVTTANEQFDYALPVIDSCIDSYVGFGLKELGFTNFVN